MTSRKLAENHAAEILSLLYPGCPVQRAGKRVLWRPGKQPLQLSEDLFGCFDFLVLAPSALVAVQATTLNGVTARKRKIERVLASGKPHYLSVGIWAWEPRRAMHCFYYGVVSWTRAPMTMRVRDGELVYEVRK